MSFQGFVWRNSTRNKRRVLLTIISVGLALFAMSTLIAVVNQIERNLEESSPLRLLTRHAVSLTNSLPERYYSQIQQVPGVAAVTTLTWFGGTYIDQANTDFAQFGCKPDTLLDVYTEFRVDPDEKKAFVGQRTAALVGRRKAAKHGWKIGDRITLKGVIFSLDLELTIRAFYDASANQEGALYFHHAYLEEGLGRPGVVGTFGILADSGESIPAIAKVIDEMYQNSNAPTKTETEKAFTMGFISMIGDLKTFITTISGIIIFTILLVTSNTMAMSVRERVREIAVLKSLGFRRWTVLGLLMSEGVLITLAGGLLGALGARFAFRSVDLAAMSQGFFQQLEVGWGVIGWGMCIAALIGLASSGIPAYQVARLTVADGLRHIG